MQPFKKITWKTLTKAYSNRRYTYVNISNTVYSNLCVYIVCIRLSRNKSILIQQSWNKYFLDHGFWSLVFVSDKQMFLFFYSAHLCQGEQTGQQGHISLYKAKRFNSPKNHILRAIIKSNPWGIIKGQARKCIHRNEQVLKNHGY